MRNINCPKDVGLENTFSGEDCVNELIYNSCNRCWSMALEKFKKQEDKRIIIMPKTYGDVYKEFYDRFPNAEVEDYRPAVGLYIPQLLEAIPNAIIVWLKDGSKIIYISESEDKNDR